MVNYFKSQLSITIKSLGFLTAFSINLILCLYNTIYMAWQCRNYDESMIPSSSEMFILRSAAPANSVLKLLYIFILVFPFGFYVYKNTKANIHPILIVRSTLKKHYCSSAFCAFTSAFLCFFLPFIINMLINAIVFPLDGTLLSGASEFTYNHTAAITGDNVFQNTIQKGEPFVELYIKSPVLYNLLYSFIFSTFCGILSVFVHSLSYFIKAMPIIMFLPLYLITFIQGKIDNVNMSHDADVLYVNYKISDYIMINTFYGKSSLYFSTFVISIILISIVLLMISYKIERDGNMRIKKKVWFWNSKPAVS